VAAMLHNIVGAVAATGNCVWWQCSGWPENVAAVAMMLNAAPFGENYFKKSSSIAHQCEMQGQHLPHCFWCCCWWLHDAFVAVAVGGSALVLFCCCWWQHCADFVVVDVGGSITLLLSLLLLVAASYWFCCFCPWWQHHPAYVVAAGSGMLLFLLLGAGCCCCCWCHAVVAPWQLQPCYFCWWWQHCYHLCCRLLNYDVFGLSNLHQ